MSTSQTEYFRDIKTARGACLRWKSLAKKHHPDIGGDADTMAEINRQYEEKLTRLKMPPKREPHLHDNYQAPERDVVVVEEIPKAPLLSDDDVKDIADTAATFAQTVVRAGVKAFVRRFTR